MNGSLGERVEAQAGSIYFLNQMDCGCREISLSLHPFNNSGTHLSWAGLLSKASLGSKADLFKKTQISAAQETEGRVAVWPQQSHHLEVLENMIHEEKWSWFMALGIINHCWQEQVFNFILKHEVWIIIWSTWVLICYWRTFRRHQKEAAAMSWW